MDITKCVRDATKVHQSLKKLDDNSVIAVKQVAIHIPERYTENGLATIGSETYIIGIFAIASEGAFGVSSVCAPMRITPSIINDIMIGEEPGIEFIFEPGDTVFADLALVAQDTMLYKVYLEFVAKGNVPWFMNYDDILGIFAAAEHHNGVKLGANDAILEMIISTMCRSPVDRSIYYRHFVKTREQVKQAPPDYIAFRSVTYGATNTTAKLIGAYFDDGLDSALAFPSKRKETIEELLRK